MGVWQRVVGPWGAAIRCARVAAREFRVLSHSRSCAIGRPLATTIAFGMFTTACDDETPAPVSEPVPVEVQVAREVAAALFSEGEDRVVEARRALEPLLRREPPYAEDLLRAAAVELDLEHPEPARDFLNQAAELGDRSAALYYLRGLYAYRYGEEDEAVEAFGRAAELAPDDLPTLLMLATVRLDQGDLTAAEPLERVRARGPDQAGSWYVAATYRLSRVRTQEGRMEEAEALLRESSTLQGRGVTPPTDLEMMRGNFGNLTVPAPQARTPVAPAGAPSYPASGETSFPEWAQGFSKLLAADLRDDARNTREGTRVVDCSLGGSDLLAYGPAGVAAASRDDAGRWTVRSLLSTPVQRIAPVDLGQDGRLDLWVVTPKGVELWLAGEDGTYRPFSGHPECPGVPEDLAVVDTDHDGDLDLLLVGSFGARLWRNDGADLPGGVFTDCTEDAGLAGLEALHWCVAEDLDSDQDVDLLLGGTGALVADDRRGGHFEIVRDVFPAGLAFPGPPVVADLDGDSRPDLWIGDAEGQVLFGRLDGGPAAARRSPAFPGARESRGVDLDGDGQLDLLAVTPEGVACLLAAGTAQSRVDVLVPAEHVADLRDCTLLPCDGGGPPLLATLSDRGLELRAPTPATRGLRLALLGRKDNRRGVGAIVELRAGRAYRRIFWRGEPMVLGLGDSERVDWLRVTWPNGVVQHETGSVRGKDQLVEQKEGLVGSCPFLYTWNGESFGFVTDVLGITPLGLPMAPGELVPPDHDEWVLVRGDQWVPQEDRLCLEFTEELREVTYLDGVRLQVVDHPADVEIQPNERFTFPPFPEPRVHAMRQLLAPRKVIGSDGRDWTEEIAAADQRLAAPFEPYRSDGDQTRGQFQGLAPEHSLELEFDPARIPAEGPLRLVLTGWFYWTDASVNLAACTTPGIEFRPPMLEVPDGQGGWAVAGPPIGFPAGKLKTMVVDVGDVLRREDPRLRISSTLRLYWDSIRLALDPSDAPTKVQLLDVDRAVLRWRGFSEPVEFPGGLGLEWFAFDHLAKEARWNQHPGLYTRYGPVEALLRDVDDRFVVLGSGDALRIEFSASELPPIKEGWSRDYLVFFDGWAKDRDPNTVEAEFVEPLPFHGMSGYPYPATESFPDDALHREWRTRWQTRPARSPLSEEPTRSLVRENASAEH